MALSKQVKQVPFLQPIDQSVSPSVSQQPQLIENLVTDKVGRLAKRWGYNNINLQIIGGDTSISNIKHIAQRAGELVIYTESGVYKYSSSLDGVLQISRSVVAEVDKTSIIRNSYNQSYPQMEKFNSTIVTVYRDSRGDHRYSAYDYVSNVIIKNDVSLGVIHNPQLITFNNKMYVFFVRDADNNICFRQIDTQSYNVGSLVEVENAVTSALRMYRVKEGNASKFSVGFIAASGNLSLGFCDTLGLQVGVRDGVPNRFVVTEDASGGFDYVLEVSLGIKHRVAWSDGSNVFVALYDSAGAEELAPVTMEAVSNLHAISFHFAGDLFFVWDETSVTPQDYTLYAAKYSLAGVADTSKYLLGGGLGLVSELFSVQDIRYIALTYTSVFQPNVFVLSEYGEVAAKFNKDSALPHRTENILVKPFQEGGTISFALETRTKLERDGEFFSQNYGVSIFDITIGSVNTSNVVLENTLYSSGSIVKAYDGASFSEAGFLLRPEESVTSAVSTATRATLEVTSTGKLTFTSVGYGTPANSISITFTSGGTAGAEVVTVVGSAISVQIQSGVSTAAQIKTAIEASVPATALVSVAVNTAGAMVSYATTNLASGTGGSLSSGAYLYAACYAWMDNFGNMHRSGADSSTAIAVTAVANDAFTVTVPTLFVTDKTGVVIEIYRTQANGVNFYLAGQAINDTTSKYTTFSDTISDADLASKELLYTTGGVLSNDSYVTSSSLTVSDNRLLLGGVEGSNRIYYTKEVRDGFGVGASDFLSINTGAKGGDVVALKGFLDSTLVFKERCVGLISGQFALDTGTEVSLKYDIITEEIGAITKKGIIEIDKGVLFQSERGLCLIDRNMAVTFVGGPVEDQRESEFSAASLLSDLQTIVFLGEGAPTVAMNYGKSMWSTFPTQRGLSSTVADGVYYYLSTDDRILKKNTSLKTNGGRAVVSRFRSPWYQVGGVGGFERLYSAAIQCQVAGSFTFRVSFYYDFEEVPRESMIYTSGEVGAWGEGTWGNIAVDQVKPLQQILSKPRFQKCTAFCVEIEEVPEADNLETEFYWQGIRLEIGLKKGYWKFDSTKATTSLLGG